MPYQVEEIWEKQRSYISDLYYWEFAEETLRKIEFQGKDAEFCLNTVYLWSPWDVN